MKRTIGLIGGTGPEGKGLAVRFALAGHDIVIGSRSAEKAAAAAAAISRIVSGRPGAGAVSGGLNEAAAAGGGPLFLAVPFSGQAATLDLLGPALEGKIVVSVISPLEFKDGRAIAAPPPAGSAAEEAAGQVPAATWLAGFHTLPASRLADPDAGLDTDILICGDDAGARAAIIELAGGIAGARAVDAGRLESARYLEGATALLININKTYRAHGSIKVVGI